MSIIVLHASSQELREKLDQSMIPLKGAPGGGKVLAKPTAGMKAQTLGSYPPKRHQDNVRV